MGSAFEPYAKGVANWFPDGAVGSDEFLGEVIAARGSLGRPRRAVVAALQHGDATVRLLGAHLLVNLAATLPCEVSNEVVCTLVCAVLERAGEEAAPGVAELLVEVALFWVKASPEIKELAMGLGCEPAVRSPAAAELSRLLAG